MPYTEDVSSVSTDFMQERMALGTVKLDALEKILGEMDVQLKATESYWKGVAAEEYRTVFGRLLKATAEDVIELRSYVDELQLYVDLSEQAHQQALSVGTNAEQLSEDVEASING